MYYLLNIVSDDGKADFISSTKFGITEFIFGLILGFILALCVILCIKHFKE